MALTRPSSANQRTQPSAHSMRPTRNAAWQQLRDAAARLSHEDLSTLQAFEKAYARLQDEQDQPGCLLAVSYAVLVVAAAYADFRDVYRHCRELLSLTLGVEPSASTQAVYRSLKQQ